MKCPALPLVLFLAPLAATVHAQITLPPGMVFAEQGGLFAGGNLAPSGTAFAKDLIGGTGVGPHVIPNLNNGSYGNDSSWIGNSDPSYAGVGFAGLQSIASFAFGRDNGGEAQVFTDRSTGNYTIEFTTDANPALNHLTAVWTSLGTMNIANGAGVSSWLRHRFNLTTPVNATGFRIVTPGGVAIDEIELYSTPGAIIPLPAGLTTTSAPGFSVGWNGNDGVNFGAGVPNNIALAANGSSAFSSGDLGPQLGIPFHIAPNVNDGIYGNGNSWIGGDGAPAPFHAGVMLPGLFEVTSIAWGRDNLAGTFGDRSLGTYTIERTLDGSTWEALGTVTLNFSDDSVAGGGVTTILRHEFDLSDGDGGVLATGIRLLVPGTGLGAGTAIDEIEIYGTLIPEPSTGLLFLAGAGLLLRRRR
jgi:hypothetical protein